MVNQSNTSNDLLQNVRDKINEIEENPHLETISIVANLNIMKNLRTMGKSAQASIANTRELRQMSLI